MFDLNSFEVFNFNEILRLEIRKDTVVFVNVVIQKLIYLWSMYEYV